MARKKLIVDYDMPQELSTTRMRCDRKVSLFPMRRSKSLLIRVLLAGICAGVTSLPVATPCVAQTPAKVPATDPVPRMQELIQSYVKSKVLRDEFMGSVLVAQGDRILINQGYGSANLEWAIPNAPDTKFRLGSLTKQFTAASILLLEERGKLSTDDLVKKYMPDAPAAWDKITIYTC
jgi:CubicO group peptidase (beta-lactamase class C family)